MKATEQRVFTVKKFNKKDKSLSNPLGDSKGGGVEGHTIQCD